jgi:protein-arginine kinase activator protein McsA
LRRLGVSQTDVECGEVESILAGAVSVEQSEQELRTKLQQAIDEENYELAASIRDALSVIEQLNTPTPPEQ